MKEIFKENLDSLRQGETCSSLFSSTWSFPLSPQKLDEVNAVDVVEDIKVEQETPTTGPVISEKLYRSIAGKFSQGAKDYFLSKNSQDLEVVFVTDEFSFEQDIDIFFDKEVSDLFSRMWKAMGLEEKKIAIIALDTNIPNLTEDEYFTMIRWWSPKLIMSLGASSTQKLLGTTRRLKDIHGRIEQSPLGSVMPIFSPKLLVSAPNMKKIVWEDMQKAMQFLN